MKAILNKFPPQKNNDNDDNNIKVKKKKNSMELSCNIFAGIILGRVVQKPVNVNPGLNVN